MGNVRGISSNTTPRTSVRPIASNAGIRRLNSEQELNDTISIFDSTKGDNTSQSDVNDGKEKSVSNMLCGSNQYVISNKDDDLKIDSTVNISSTSDEESVLYNKATQRRLSLVSLASVLSDISFDKLQKDVASVESELE